MTRCTRALLVCVNSSLSQTTCALSFQCSASTLQATWSAEPGPRTSPDSSHTRWTGRVPQKPERLSVSRHSSSYLLLVSLPCSFVLCLPCLYICPCLGQLKPGRSLSRLASTANLRIVPFIRLAPSHNKTPLTRSLKSVQRTQCERAVIAFEWARMITLIYFF